MTLKLAVIALIAIAFFLLLGSCSSTHNQTTSQTPTPPGPVQASTVSCPTTGLAGTACYALDITCPNIPNYTAYVKIITPANPVGTVIFTTGGDGNYLYETYVHGTEAVQNVVNANFEAVQLTWGQPFSNGLGWEHDVNGQGVIAAACRYAMVVQWVASQTSGVPLCATGNSAGGQNISEGLAHYGLGDSLTFAEITSGPPFNRVDWACIDDQAPAVEYCSGSDIGMGVGEGNAVNFIDPSYPGPWCSTATQTHSTQHEQTFLNDSVTAPGAVLSYPNTKIRFLYGGQDMSSAIRQGLNYQSQITTPTTFGCVADAPHSMADSPDGAQTIAADLIANCHQ